MTDSLDIDALQKAIALRQPPCGLIHHSDFGEQYASNDYRAILCRADCRQKSMSGAPSRDSLTLERHE